MIRVLIADDSPTMRALVRAVLESDRELTVVGEATNGEEAVALCRALAPDIATMDVRMPNLDGIEAIRRIMAERPVPIIVLTSPESDRELGITYKGIEAGAVMVLGKPAGLPGQDPDAARLISHVKAMAGVKVVTRRTSDSHRQPSAHGPPEPSRDDIPSPAGDRRETVQLVAIGTSTGGPPALQVILAGLPADFRVPILVVQHMSLGFIAGLARWLDETVAVRVKVAEPGEVLRPATVYLAPDESHLQAVGSGRVWLQPGPTIDGHCPSITALFRSLARTFGPATVAVLLTGMGRDGAAGLLELRRTGAWTIAQDESSSIVFGMPKEAIALGAAAEVLPLGRIGPRLQELVGRPVAAGRPEPARGGGP